MSSPVRLMIPAPEALKTDAEPFNPTIYVVNQEEALEATIELSDLRCAHVGSLEMYSGTHPKYGRVIITITASSDATIIPLS